MAQLAKSLIALSRYEELLGQLRHQDKTEPGNTI